MNLADAKLADYRLYEPDPAPDREAEIERVSQGWSIRDVFNAHTSEGDPLHEWIVVLETIQQKAALHEDKGSFETWLLATLDGARQEIAERICRERVGWKDPEWRIP